MTYTTFSRQRSLDFSSNKSVKAELSLFVQTEMARQGMLEDDETS